MTDQPIACTLTPGDMTARVALIDALAADGVLERTAAETGIRVRLLDQADLAQRAGELLAAESRCCAFLDFDLRRETGALLLDVSGPEDARPVIEFLFAPEPH